MRTQEGRRGLLAICILAVVLLALFIIKAPKAEKASK